MSNDLAIIGARGVDRKGAAYLYHLNGTEIKKLTPGDDGEEGGLFGTSASIDEKVVVGSFLNNYVQVFSRQGIYERSIRCDDCSYFGRSVATHGNLIAVVGEQNDIWKLFMFTTEGRLLKSFFEQGIYWSSDVAISFQFIVSTFTKDGRGKTIIYSNQSPDFPKIAEIN